MFQSWYGILIPILLIILFIILYRAFYRDNIVALKNDEENRGVFYAIYKYSGLMYLIVVSYCLFSAIFGIYEFSLGADPNVLYGIDAIRMCIIYIFLFSWWCPIIPIVIIYRIIYPIIRTIKRKKKAKFDV